MPVVIGGEALADFRDPLKMLVDCHRRIERFLNVLGVLAARAQDGAIAATDRALLSTGLRYFEVGAPRHTADEEESLFPLLRSRDSLALLGELESEHRAKEKLHQLVGGLFRQWLERDECLPGSQARHLKRAMEELRGIYRRHIRVEEEVVFPLAARVLSAGDLSRIGEEMARRRADLVLAARSE